MAGNIGCGGPPAGITGGQGGPPVAGKIGIRGGPLANGGTLGPAGILLEVLFGGG